MPKIEPKIREYLCTLVARYPGIRSVWLIGSRANSEERESSDWDFIVFADRETFNQLRLVKELHWSNVDLLVVYNSDGQFEKPWDSPKSGSLAIWKWTKLSSNEAEYEATKWIESGQYSSNGQVETPLVSRKKAVKIWPLEKNEKNECS